jgi:hypothetical protein
MNLDYMHEKNYHTETASIFFEDLIYFISDQTHFIKKSQSELQ